LAFFVAQHLRCRKLLQVSKYSLANLLKAVPHGHRIDLGPVRLHLHRLHRRGPQDEHGAHVHAGIYTANFIQIQENFVCKFQQNFRKFQKISENFRKFQKISAKFGTF
jgi:hypothetical protein